MHLGGSDGSHGVEAGALRGRHQGCLLLHDLQERRGERRQTAREERR